SVDAKCQTCHLGDGRDVHHANRKLDMTPNCGHCHSDHHGRDFALTRTADRDCIVCHKDLPASMDGSPHYAAKITAFGDDHPEFKLLRDKEKDPGKLKFNHKYHMTPGIVLAEGGKAFTVQEIAAGEQRERFRNSQKDD